MESFSSDLALLPHPNPSHLTSKLPISPGNAYGLPTLLSTVDQRLQQFFASPTAVEQLSHVFETASIEAIQGLVTDSLADRLRLPSIRVLDDSAMGGARGAYSSEENTIYLAASLLQGDPLLQQTVVLEEMGHYFDTLLNPGQDTPGDEGELFRAIASGIPLSPSEYGRIRSENDTGTITVDDCSLVVEQNNDLSTAFDLGILDGGVVIQDFVGSTDPNDYYRFTLNQQSEFTLALSGLSSDADVELLDSNGQLIDFSIFGGTSGEWINQTLDAGVYYVRVYPYIGDTNYTLSLTATRFEPLSFTSFNVFDASGDSTRNSLFQGGAIGLNYTLSDTTALSNVRLEAWGNNTLFDLGTWNAANLSNALINLDTVSGLTGGDYLFRVVASTFDGREYYSDTQTLRILSWDPLSTTTYGTFAGETLTYTGGLGSGTVVVGRGGTDTLDLTGVFRSSIRGINGVGVDQFTPLTVTNQAIFRGTAFDYLTLSDGREIYFQGIENLRFGDGSTLELQLRTDDPLFGSQWNISVSDVGIAWRFTQGSGDVLLVSLDTGVRSSFSVETGDLTANRLLGDPNLDDDKDSDHGHMAISVMSSSPNNGYGTAGINWNSAVYVQDVYGDVSLQQAIQNAIAYARANNLRVVFQGGIQGEFWFNSGGTRAQLEQLIHDNADIAMFAIAAGNGNIDIDIDDLNNPVVWAGLSGGVARLQTTYGNVMAVGALESRDSAGNLATAVVNGLTNATDVRRAPYSNFGQSLTLMAATDSLAVDIDGTIRNFNGTSAANPNMAAIASLVWSVNANLDGEDLRQILTDTSMDIGAEGRDTTFGHGLVNADAAVRRAWALNQNAQLANLYSGRSQFA